MYTESIGTQHNYREACSNLVYSEGEKIINTIRSIGSASYLEQKHGLQ